MVKAITTLNSEWKSNLYLCGGGIFVVGLPIHAGLPPETIGGAEWAARRNVMLQVVRCPPAYS